MSALVAQSRHGGLQLREDVVAYCRALYVKLLKGSSSRYLTKQIIEPSIDAFSWQEHYGMLTFGERSLELVVRYIERQAKHHANDDIWQSFELIQTSPTDARADEKPGRPKPKGY